MQVPTVRGSVDTSELGVTLMHEHIFVLSEGVRQTFPFIWDEEVIVQQAIADLREVAGLGVQTFVDLTVYGLGRRIDLIKRIAEQVPLNIVVATGIYTYNELPHYFESRDVDHMASMFVRDIKDGIDNTGIKAAVLKCATDKAGVTPGVEKVLRAVARAHNETGVPIYTHTDAKSRQGLPQQAIFKEEGVNLRRTVIGHCGDTDDIDYLVQLLQAGSYIGMDRFGLDAFLPFEKRVTTVAELCQMGHAGSMFLSHDYCSYCDFLPPEQIRALGENYSYTHIHRDVIPALKKAGVADEQLNQMLVENPRKFFEGR